MSRSVHALIFVVLVAGATLLAACSATPARRAPESAAGGTDATTVIYVIRRKWHVDIGFAAADLAPPLASLRSDLPGARFLVFGFGDRHYLLDKDRGRGGMLAALWPGAGLILATGVTASLQAAFGADNVIELPLGAMQSRQAQEFLWSSLAAAGGAITPLQVGPYEGSLYYAATPRYSAVHTCNTWAAQALRAAQLPVHSVGVVLAGQLWVQARRLAARRDADSTDLRRPPSRASPQP